MVIVPFKPEHFFRMKLQPAQLNAVGYVSDEYVSALAKMGPCATALDGDRVIGSCGIAQTITGGILWAFVSEDAGRYMVKLDRCARRFLSAIPAARIEATVEKGFLPGCRWLDLLGFEFEGVMRKYGPDGKDHLRYARIT